MAQSKLPGEPADNAGRNAPADAPSRPIEATTPLP